MIGGSFRRSRIGPCGVGMLGNWHAMGKVSKELATSHDKINTAKLGEITARTARIGFVFGNQNDRVPIRRFGMDIGATDPGSTDNHRRLPKDCGASHCYDSVMPQLRTNGNGEAQGRSHRYPLR